MAQTVKVSRPSFDAVFNTQEALRVLLDKLIEENRPLTDDKERKDFFQHIAYATFGLGKDVVLTFNDGKGGAYLSKDIETVCRWAAYLDSAEVVVPDCLNKRVERSTTVPIRDLWRCIRDNLFSVFPLALERSFGMSKEQEAQVQSKGVMVTK